jgi:very-long-chain (3R)-3-hydroxyacyl-CoA dehydratase
MPPSTKSSAGGAPAAAPAKSSLAQLYLILYNAAAIAAWGYLDVLLASHFLAHGLSVSPWAVVELPLKIAQTSAVLEIVHAALGLVRSNPATTALQGASAAVLRARAPPPPPPHRAR